MSSVILIRQAYICLLWGGRSESIFRETVALSPRGGIALSALRPFCLHSSPVLSGKVNLICRETVALSPPPVQTGHPSPPCEARHAPPGFCDICPAGQKYGSRLGNASPTACITCFARRICEPEASRLLRMKHANASSFALLSASAYICLQQKYCCASAEQINLFCSRLLCIFAFCFIWGSKVFGYVQCE